MSLERYIVQHRRGTLDQWKELAENGGSYSIPQEGEFVIELDRVNKQHKFKIGDGESTFEELQYLGIGEDFVVQKLVEERPRVVTVTLEVDKWQEEGEGTGKYYQEIDFDDITEYSRLDLQPDASQLADFKLLNLVFVTENKKNDPNTIIVHSVGDKPLNTYTMQASIVETDPKVEYDKIVGIPVGTPTSKSDWKETNSLHANYIDNKPAAADSSTVFSAEVIDGQFVIEQKQYIYYEAPPTEGGDE